MLRLTFFKQMKTWISFFLLSLVLAGCSRPPSVMSYSEASAVFSTGLTEAELVSKYGNPTIVENHPNMVTWDYVPIKEIEKGGKKEYSGFTIILVDGKSVKISERVTVVN